MHVTTLRCIPLSVLFILKTVLQHLRYSNFSNLSHVPLPWYILQHSISIINWQFWLFQASSAQSCLLFVINNQEIKSFHFDLSHNSQIHKTSQKNTHCATIFRFLTFLFSRKLLMISFSFITNNFVFFPL